jgi:electron transfer flavoprotein beta subunit
MLSLVVCVKAVPDPKEADKIRMDPVTKSLPRHAIPLVINTLDRNALEAALQLKETGDAHITVISMGPPPAGNVLKECLALGADVGILLSDPAFAGADAYATAYTLAKAIEKLSPVDCVFCGRASSDGATEWVGPELATFLDMPVVTMVREIIETKEGNWVVKADFENGYRLVSVKLPSVLTVTKNINNPRTLSFSGIIKARKKEITTWGLKELGLQAESVGLTGSPTIVTDMTPIESRREAEILQGSLQEKVEGLVEILSNAGVVNE